MVKNNFLLAHLIITRYNFQISNRSIKKYLPQTFLGDAFTNIVSNSWLWDFNEIARLLTILCERYLCAMICFNCMTR